MTGAKRDGSDAALGRSGVGVENTTGFDPTRVTGSGLPQTGAGGYCAVHRRAYRGSVCPGCGPLWRWPVQPDQPHSRLTEGWLTGPGNRVAHLFSGGHSACHRWFSTPLDELAKPSDTRCPECTEQEGRTLV